MWGRTRLIEGQTVRNAGLAVAFTDQGVVTFVRQSLQVWDAATGARKAHLLAEQLPGAKAMGASRDGRLIATSIRTGVQFWDPVAEKSRNLPLDVL